MKSKTTTEPRVLGLSNKEALILELLLETHSGEAYGLELVTRSVNRLKRGTVYVTLDRMEQKGFIESRKEEPKANVSGLPRRLYHATGYGEKVYNAWQLAKKALRFRKIALGGVL
jgi:PadR family transcriptional regulator PadR